MSSPKLYTATLIPHIKANAMNRRVFLTALTGALAANACSNNVTVRTLSNVIGTSLSERSAFDPSYPDKLPYASIAVSRKGLERSLLVLGKAEGDELHWISADRGVLVTRHGRLIKTVGFTENLLKTDFSGDDYFASLSISDWEKKTSYRRIIDLSPGNRYGITIESTLELAGSETIQIGSHSYETTRLREHNVAQSLGWQYTNTYWLDAQGKIWRSEQTFAPGMPPLTIEVTKPYRA